MSDMTPQQYRPSRRSWIKLWVNEWLDGTVRWQLTQQQRSMWADLLALAGYSRFPGIVTPGNDGQGFIPYPIDHLCNVFRCTKEQAEETLEILEKQERIRRDENGVIHIINWHKYQSEYQEKRQRTRYSKKSVESTSNVHSKSLESPLQEVEVDTEVEGETPFGVFWNLYPRKVGKEKAMKSWRGMSKAERESALTGLSFWNQAEQWNRDGGKYIPHASTFLNERRYREEPWAGAFSGK